MLILIIYLPLKFLILGKVKCEICLFVNVQSDHMIS